MENSVAGRLLLMVAGIRTFVSPSLGNFSFRLSSSITPCFITAHKIRNYDTTHARHTHDDTTRHTHGTTHARQGKTEREIPREPPSRR